MPKLEWCQTNEFRWTAISENGHQYLIATKQLAGYRATYYWRNGDPEGLPHTLGLFETLEEAQEALSNA